MTDSFAHDHTDALDWPTRPASISSMMSTQNADEGLPGAAPPAWLKYVDDTLDVLKSLAHDHDALF